MNTHEEKWTRYNTSQNVPTRRVLQRETPTNTCICFNEIEWNWIIIIIIIVVNMYFFVKVLIFSLANVVQCLASIPRNIEWPNQCVPHPVWNILFKKKNQRKFYFPIRFYRSARLMLSLFQINSSFFLISVSVLSFGLFRKTRWFFLLPL